MRDAGPGDSIRICHLSWPGATARLVIRRKWGLCQVDRMTGDGSAGEGDLQVIRREDNLGIISRHHKLAMCPIGPVSSLQAASLESGDKDLRCESGVWCLASKTRS